MRAPTASDTPPTAAPAPRLTLRQRVIRWLGVVGLVLLVAVVALIATPQTPAFERLDPTNPGQGGARAVATLLADQGVEIITVTDRNAAETALAEGGTLVLTDPAGLSDAAVGRLYDAAAGDIVLIDPTSRSLRLTIAGSAVAGRATGVAAPECDLADAERAGDIVAEHVFDADRDVTRCYPSGAGWALLVASNDAGSASTRTVVVDGDLLTNEHLAEAGNAALALNLLGRDGRLVWYLPRDTDQAGDLTLGDLTPDWTAAGVALLAIAVIAAGVWRGRRFGPLVTERLPVTVRASETLDGRANLYRRGGDVPHAASALRSDTIRRLARALGLPRRADASAVATSAAAVIGVAPDTVAALLSGPSPVSERGLVDLSDHLHTLVTAVEAAIRSGRTAS